MSRNEYTCGISGKRFIDIDDWRSCRDAHDCQHDCPYERNRGEITPKQKDSTKENNSGTKTMTTKEVEHLFDGNKPTLEQEIERATNEGSSFGCITWIVIIIILSIIGGVVFGIYWIIQHWPFR
jgi:hypothetical protein